MSRVIRELSEIEEKLLTPEQKRAMLEFDNDVRRSTRRFRDHTISVGTEQDLESFLNNGKPPGKK